MILLRGRDRGDAGRLPADVYDFAGHDANTWCNLTAYYLPQIGGR